MLPYPDQPVLRWPEANLATHAHLETTTGDSHALHDFKVGLSTQGIVGDPVSYLYISVAGQRTIGVAWTTTCILFRHAAR